MATFSAEAHDQLIMEAIKVSMEEEANQSSAAEVEPPLYKTDEFRTFCFKVLACSKRYCHDWTVCPFAHPGEKARRRDPRAHTYTGIACPDMKKDGACMRGDACPYAHNVFEYWLHPTRYRTQLCNDGTNCKRRVCFFAHTLEELRVPSSKPFVPPEALAAATTAANMEAARKQAAALGGRGADIAAQLASLQVSLNANAAAGQGGSQAVVDLLSSLLRTANDQNAKAKADALAPLVGPRPAVAECRSRHSSGGSGPLYRTSDVPVSRAQLQAAAAPQEELLRRSFDVERRRPSEQVQAWLHAAQAGGSGSIEGQWLTAPGGMGRGPSPFRGDSGEAGGHDSFGNTPSPFGSDWGLLGATNLGRPGSGGSPSTHSATPNSGFPHATTNPASSVAGGQPEGASGKSMLPPLTEGLVFNSDLPSGGLPAVSQAAKDLHAAMAARGAYGGGADFARHSGEWSRPTSSEFSRMSADFALGRRSNEYSEFSRRSGDFSDRNSRMSLESSDGARSLPRRSMDSAYAHYTNGGGGAYRGAELEGHHHVFTRGQAAPAPYQQYYRSPNDFISLHPGHAHPAGSAYHLAQQQQLLAQHAAMHRGGSPVKPDGGSGPPSHHSQAQQLRESGRPADGGDEFGRHSFESSASETGAAGLRESTRAGSVGDGRGSPALAGVGQGAYGIGSSLFSYGADVPVSGALGASLRPLGA